MKHSATIKILYLKSMRNQEAAEHYNFFRASNAGKRIVNISDSEGHSALFVKALSKTREGPQ